MLESPYRYLTPEEAALLPEFEHPLVELAYSLLCDDVMPPVEEHWEGFAARRIVRAVIEELKHPTGEMWVAGRVVFQEEAERFRAADRYELASAIADRAPEKILFAMLQSALRTASIPNEEGSK